MLGLFVSSVLAVSSCPRDEPPGFEQWTQAAVAELRARCETIDRDPVYLGRLRTRRYPIELGMGFVVHGRGTRGFAGPSVRFAATLPQGAFFSVDAGLVWSTHGNSQLFGIGVGVPIRLGQWLVRPSASFGGARTENWDWGPGAFTYDVRAGGGVELLVPLRFLGLGVDGGIVVPIAGQRALAWDAAGQVTVVLTWYFA